MATALARAMAFAACALVFFMSAASAEKMRFAVVGTGGNCASCGWIEAEGEITPETPDDFDRFVQASTQKQMTLHGLLVTLNSPGGNVSAAVDLGEAFRKQVLSLP